MASDELIEERAQPWMTRWLLGSLQVADALNERFLSLVRGADGLVRSAGRAVRRAPRAEPAASRHEPDDLARWARLRLSDLHLRVGQSIYRLEAGAAETEPVKRQLIALLDEIERLEDVLKLAGGAIENPIPENLEALESLVASLEVETERNVS